jgi:hypothetical protein
VLSVRLKVYGNIDSNSFLLQEKQLNTNWYEVGGHVFTLSVENSNR